MQLTPYLNFNGRTEEAIEFYKTALGAKVDMLMRFNDAPEPCPGLDPSMAKKVMHSTLRIGDSVLMATDGHCQPGTKFEGISLSFQAPTAADTQRIFAALADGGMVTQPLSKTFFSPLFGMVTDRFGVSWMILVAM